MDKALLEQTVGTIVSQYPQVIPHLSEDVFAVLCKEYNPDQPRVPAGVPEGGQWTSEGGGGEGGTGEGVSEGGGGGDGNGYSRETVESHIDNLSQKYGIKPTINYYSSENSGTLAIAKRNITRTADGTEITSYVIHINEAEMKALNTEENTGWFVDSTVRGTINHEYGHLLTPARTLFLNDMEDRYLMKNAVSGYARREGSYGDEALAELFSAYEIGQVSDPKLMAIFNKAAKKEIMK